MLRKYGHIMIVRKPYARIPIRKDDLSQQQHLHIGYIILSLHLKQGIDKSLYLD